MGTEVKETVDVRWAEARLEDITKPDAKILYGILQPGPDIPDGIPYVRPTEMDKDEILVDQIRRTTPAIAAKYKRSLLEAGDVLLSIVGTIGKVAIVPKELEGGNITQSSVRIRAGSKVNGDFLAWFLRSPRAFAQYDAARLGTAVPRLNVAHVRDLLVPIPQLPQQRRIVSAIELQLGRLDAAVARLQTAKAKLKQYKQAVLNAAIPFGDDTVELQKVTRFIDYRGKTPAKTEGGIPLVTAKNVRFGYVDEEPREYIASEDYDSWMRRGIPSPGDVLFTTEAPLGNVAQLPAGRIALAQRIITMVPGERLTQEYLMYALMTPAFQAKLEAHGSGTTVKGIKSSVLKTLTIPVPPIAEQHRTAEWVRERYAAAELTETILDSELVRSKRLRQAVLKRAFEGRLV